MPVILRLIPDVHSSWSKNQTALRHQTETGYMPSFNSVC